MFCLLCVAFLSAVCRSLSVVCSLLFYCFVDRCCVMCLVVALCVLLCARFFLCAVYCLLVVGC